MDTSTAAPPNPAKAAKGAAKGLGGKLKNLPPWAYVAGVVLIIGVAIMFRRGGGGDTTAPVADSTTGGFTGDASTFPDASQGAFGGFSDPAPANSVTDGTNDGTNPQPPASINIYMPGPAPVDSTIPAATATGSSSITGGGTHPARNAAVQHLPAPKVVGNAALVKAATKTAPAVYVNNKTKEKFHIEYVNVTTGKGKNKKTVRHAVHVYPDGHRVDMGPA